MGNTCCDRSKKSVQADYISPNDSDEESQLEKSVIELDLRTDCSLLLRNQFQNFAKFHDDLKKKIYSSEIKNDSALIFNEKLLFLPSNLKFYYEVSDDLQNGFKQNVTMIESSFPCSKELCYLFDLNMNQEEHRLCDDNIDKFELIDFWQDQTTLIQISLTVSKKILIIEPRNALVVNLLHKSEKEDLASFHIGLDKTDLKEVPKYSELINSLKNRVLIDFGGKIGANSKTGCCFTTYSKFNALSNVGKPLMRPVFKKNVKKQNENYWKLVVKFAMTASPLYLRWFKEEKKRPLLIFIENLEKFKNLDLSSLGYSASDIDNRLQELKELSLKKKKAKQTSCASNLANSDHTAKVSTMESQNVASFSVIG